MKVSGAVAMADDVEHAFGYNALMTDKPSEMIERVARAICRAGICGPRSHLDEQENLHWRRFEIEAKAAIAAMREPTVYMTGNDPALTKLYQAMIDAALAP